jgi:(2R)-3-sulfolactate dehydrogenase (NADP+)
VTAATVSLRPEEARELGERALMACGASLEAARLMAGALVEAQAQGNTGVGFAHLETYCDGLRAGRIDAAAEPVIQRPSGAVFHVDARGGFGHVAFHRLLPQLVTAAHESGLALFSQRNSYTNAALDWFVRRLAEQGLMALAGTNGGPALLAASGASEAVFCTNPLAFAAPRGEGQPLVIDQSCSATAYVNLRMAAERGETIPEGWALDADGNPTTDAAAALAGVLLPFGGARGANVALMVELLAAGLSGANWSLDAPSFLDGDSTPGIGLFVLAMDAERISGDDASARIAQYLERLEREHHVYMPGASRAEAAARAEAESLLLDAELVQRLRAFTA